MRKPSFLNAVLPAVVLMMGCRMAAFAQNTPMTSACYLFIGTYAPADSNGIFVYRFDTNTGKASRVSAIKGIENPSFLITSPDQRFVYAVSETHGEKGGSVYAYKFDPGNGRLHYLNSEPSGGKDPCYLTADQTGHWIMVGNYSSGSLSVLPVKEQGTLGKAVQTIRHHGHSIDKERQAEPHVHCIMLAPNNHDVFVTDLGTDKIMTYLLNEEDGHLSAGKPPYTQVMPGSGPRHLAFHPNGKNVYLIQEMGGKITVFNYEPGKLSAIQTISTLPDGYQGRIWASAIHISPDGKFLYASNRDDLNDIVTYAIDPKNGQLTYKGRQATGGKTARDFVISPDGKYVLAGHQNDDKITIFKRDADTGLLTPTNEEIHVPHAVCLKMIPPPSAEY